MTSGKIPFLDLVGPHRELEKELTSAFTSALRSGSFVGGSMVEEFESAFAEFCGSRYAVAVNSGTDALRFALLAAGVKQNDVAITVPNTFIATTEAISQAGATPMFVDIDEQTFSMSPQKLESFFSDDCVFDASSGKMLVKKSRRPVTAIVPVHLYGQTADMDPILAIAEKYGCIVIEDACQAHGSEYYSEKRGGGWHKAGTFGKAAAFSFYPGKNLGALGEGGAVTTDDENIAAFVRKIRDHGQQKKYYHDMEGYNGRLDAIQAGFLSVKLKHLDRWNKERRKHAHYYNYLLGSFDGLVLPLEPKWAKAIYHLYVIRVPRRDELQKHLSLAGIGTGLHYPVPLHLQKAYAYLPYEKGDFPVTEKAASEILSLPMFPGLTEEQQKAVVESIADFMESPKTALLFPQIAASTV
jgi:dTDP-4-amino-4,6-dideoxygalactose transaminase